MVLIYWFYFDAPNGTTGCKSIDKYSNRTYTCSNNLLQNTLKECTQNVEKNTLIGRTPVNTKINIDKYS